jgi:hypothetical protein
MIYLKKFEDIKIPIEIGDTILGGRFKNKKTVVKKIGKNAKGDITVNGKPLLKYRLVKESIESFEEDTAELLLPIRDMGMQIQFFKSIPMLVRIFTGSVEYSFDNNSFDWKSIEADVQTYVSYMTEELGYIFNLAYYIGDNSSSGYKRLQIEKEDISEGRIPEKIKMIAIEFTK